MASKKASGVSLDDLINAEFGNQAKDLSKEENVTNLTDEDFISTGNYALNYATSKRFRGGIPRYKITGLIGLSSVGKSLLTANFNKDKKITRTFIFETEGGGNNADLFKFVESPWNKVVIVPVNTFTCYRINKENGLIEEVAEKEVPANQETDKYYYKRGLISYVKSLLYRLDYNHITDETLIIIDSLSNVKSVRQLAGGYDMGMSGQNRNDFFSSIDGLVEKTKATLVFTNKMYNSMDQYDPWRPSGGPSVDYNPSLNITLTALSSSEDMGDAGAKAEKLERTTARGSALRAVRGRVSKSRYGTFSRNATFLMDSTYGIVPNSGLFQLLCDFGVCVKEGNRFVIKDVPGLDKPFYKKDFLTLFGEHEDEYIDKLQKIMDNVEIEIAKKRRNLNVNDFDEGVEAESDDEISTTDMAREMEAEMEAEAGIEADAANL